MSPQLRLSMLGSLQIEVDGIEQSKELLAKSQAMLCYLALQEGMHSRNALAGLLWRDMDEAYALRNLRVNLSKVRKQCGTYLHIERRALGMDETANVWLDVRQFVGCTVTAGQNGRSDIAALETAVSLYRGELLEGFTVTDAPAFEEWLGVERARLAERYLVSLRTLVEHFLAEHEYNRGIAYAVRWKTAAPLYEEAHRRLMLLYALNSQRGQALAAYDECCTALADIDVVPDGETETLLSQIKAGQIQGQRPDTGAFLKLKREEDKVEDRKTAVPFLVPPEPEVFVGRDVELAVLRRRFARAMPEARTFALVGLGGIGKTTLATEAAHALRDYFSDGVLWADANTRDPMDIAEEWAAQYGYQFRGLKTLEERAAALRSVLNEKQALLIFDDVFHASKVKMLFPAEGKCVVLATTRNADLARVLEAEILNISELSAQGGRALVAEIVGEARVEEEEGAVAESGRLLQYHPLALTLAAKIVALRPLRRFGDLVARLQQEKLRLDLSLGNVEVRATFALSWNLLDERHRRTFRLLAPFGGRRFTVAAYCAVAEEGQWDALDRLDILVSLSLLGANGTHAYRQHALLADFASEKLAAAGEADAAKSRLVTYYLTFVEQHQQDYEALQPEWENLSAVIKMAQELGLRRETIRFTEMLKEGWFANGRYTNARAAYRLAEDAATRLEDENALGQIWLGWGEACLEQSDYHTASSKLQRSLEIYQSLSNYKYANEARIKLSSVAIFRSNFARAKELLDECLEYIQSADNEFQYVHLINGLSKILYYQQKYQDASDLAQKALDTVNSSYASELLFNTLELLVNIKVEQFNKNKSQEVAQILKYAFEAVEVAKKLNRRDKVAVAHYLLSRVYALTDNLLQATNNAKISLEMMEHFGDLRSQAILCQHLCEVNFKLRKYTLALEFADKGIDLIKDTVLYERIAILHGNKGVIYKTQGLHQNAEMAWKTALEIARSISHSVLITTFESRLKA